MSSRVDSWEYLSKCLQMSCRYQTSHVATFRLYLIPPGLKFTAESINPPSLCSFLPSFHLWITSPNPNSRKFTETHRGHVQIVRAARGPDQKQRRTAPFFSGFGPEEAVVREHINRT